MPFNKIQIQLLQNSIKDMLIQIEFRRDPSFDCLFSFLHALNGERVRTTFSANATLNEQSTSCIEWCSKSSDFLLPSQTLCALLNNKINVHVKEEAFASLEYTEEIYELVDQCLDVKKLDCEVVLVLRRIRCDMIMGVVAT